MTVLDWEQRIAVPAHGIDELAAKLDTGAKTSSIHAERIDTFRMNGEEWVRFQTRSSAGQRVTIERPVLSTRRIKSSNGKSERRLVVELPIELAGSTVDTEFTLADRSDMTYPVLLGRRALSGRFLVNSRDVAR